MLMTDTLPSPSPSRLSRAGLRWFSRAAPTPDNRFTEQALERHKREGLDLAVRARTLSMCVIACVVGWLTPWPAVIYYLGIIVVFVLIGLAQRRVGTVGQNRWELVLLFCDLALMTLVAVVPNPLDDRIWPLAFQYRFETFMYFFVILGAATLAYSWRTIIAVGTWTAMLWTLGALYVWTFTESREPWQSGVAALYPDHDTMVWFLDPSNVVVEIRVQQIIVFLLVAVTLAVSVRRFQNLILSQAGIERERANLARYFSPDVVEQLSHNDQPLKEVREQDVGVLFVDIVGFTSFAADRPPQDVIETLRAFHARMEGEVFRHAGTLDKYLGDGLMATFGTPSAGQHDALSAVKAALAMADSMDVWNKERADAGEPAIQASFGVHYGPVVLGDIGANRLEFAVIGSTVNLASRLEALTRRLSARIVISATTMQAVQDQAGPGDFNAGLWRQQPPQSIRGFDQNVSVWTWG